MSTAVLRGDQPPFVFAFPGNEAFAERLAVAMDAPLGSASFHEFPDCETLVRVDSDVAGRDTIVVLTWRHPNEKFLPLLFFADALRDAGAKRIGLVAPYLSYMRQDTRFHPGEAITSRTFASAISRAVDWLATVDPHLHRYAALDAIYAIPAAAVHVAPELGAWIAAHVDQPFLIGPDAESRQWVEAIAAAACAPSTVLTKTRRGDSDVIESIPDLAAHPRCTPVLVDDIIATGRTMAAAMVHLRDVHAAPAVCVGVHAVFADGALDVLTAAGATRVATTNSIPHPTNAIDVVPALSSALETL